jgi:hypothetical protein
MEYPGFAMIVPEVLQPCLPVHFSCNSKESLKQGSQGRQQQWAAEVDMYRRASARTILCATVHSFAYSRDG